MRLFLCTASISVAFCANLSADSDLLSYYHQKNEFDNELLRAESWKLLVNGPPKFIEDGRQKVLFIGDSHSKDMFNVFYQNGDLYNGFQFSRMGDRPKRNWYFMGDSFQELTRNKLFLEAEIVVISDNIATAELEFLEDLITFLKQQEKQVILMSRTNEYEVVEKPLLTQYDILLRRLLAEGKGMTENDLAALRQQLYRKRTRDTYEPINEKLAEIARRTHIPYLEKHDFLCDDARKECDVVTDDGIKIFYDYGHYTLEGARYFGRKIHDLNWFRVEP